MKNKCSSSVLCFFWKGGKSWSNLFHASLTLDCTTCYMENLLLLFQIGVQFFVAYFRVGHFDNFDESLVLWKRQRNMIGNLGFFPTKVFTNVTEVP